MPLILLAEEETQTIDHVRSALASQGWLVKTVGTRDQALRAASEFAPQLVLINDRLSGAQDLVRTFSKRSGGPGVVLLTTGNGHGPDTGTGHEDVDAVLAKPLNTGQLIEAIRHGLADGKAPLPTVPSSGNNKVFSSEEIFGDLLDDILDPQHADRDDSVSGEAQPGAAAAAAGKAAVTPTPPSDTEITAEPAAEEVNEIETAAEARDSEQPSPVIDIADAKGGREQAAPQEAESMPVAGLEDLEEVVREEVAAWADTVQPEAGFVVAGDDGEAEADAAARPIAAETEQDTAPEAVAAETTSETSTPEEDLDARLEDTLAGVLAESLSQAETSESDAETSAREADSVDALLSQALGDLDLGSSVTTDETETADASELDHQLAALTASLAIEPPAAAPVVDVVAEPAEVEIELEADVDVDQQVEAQPESDDEDAESAEARDDLEPRPAADSAELPASGAAQGIEFGEYTLEQQIGVGGMASVWKARRKGVEGFEKRVAIKKILPQAAENEDFVEMFIDEAKLAAQLNHNNITHIYDLGKIDDDYFIAMEYVEGKNLRQILDQTRRQEKPIPVGVALFIASQIADGLDYAHHSKDFDDAELGLVHRDVSPQNVLIGFTGDVKLCDFGIAKAVSKISTTQMGALKGKLQYMSPEQAWGKQIDHRSDIFSLGTLLYEMLAGERLFSGDSEMAVLEAVRQADVGAQIIQSPGIPAGVRGLLLRSLSKEPEDRFDTAAELQRGLEELLKEESPAPGPKAVSAFVRDLLGMKSDLVEITPDETSESGLEMVEELDEGLDWATSDGEPEESADPAKERWLRRLLTRLLPVVLVVAIGGGIVAGLMQQDAVPGSETQQQTAGLSRAPVFDPSQVTEEPAAVDPRSQPPPVRAESSPTPAPPPQPTPQEPKPTPIQDSEPQAAGPVASPEVAQSDDLERRVEEELQRVQQLITTPVETSSSSPEAAVPATDRASSESPRADDAANPQSLPVELVQPGPGVVEPRVVEIQQPAYTPEAEQAGIEGTIRVSVLVDEFGKAVDVRLIEGLPQRLGLEEAVMESARQAIYEPATRDGVPARMWREVAILFELE